MELNARLQVEHPVTEAVTGLDLVEAQLRVAAGEPLWLRQADVRLRGHAVEARLYAEDPWAGFAPSSGTVESVTWPTPAEDLRVDAGVGTGDVIGTRYDPLLAKVIASGQTRATALGRLDQALAATATVGVTTNRDFLRAVLAWPEVRQGRVATDTLEARWQPAVRGAPRRRLGTRGGCPGRGRRREDRPRRRSASASTDRAVSRWPSARRRAWSSPRPSRDRPAGEAVRSDGSVVLDVGGRAIVARLAPPPSVADAVRHAAPADDGDIITRAAAPASSARCGSRRVRPWPPGRSC